MKEKWSTLGIKDKIQYVMAVMLIVSGIVLAFISFFFTNDVTNGVLIYISEAFITAGGIFGVSIYFKDQLRESRSFTLNQIEEIIRKAIEEKKDSN